MHVILPCIMLEMMDNPGRNLQRFQDELNGPVYNEQAVTHVLAQNGLTQKKRRITQELRDSSDSK